MLWWLTATGPWRFPIRRAKLIAFALAALTIAPVVMSALAADDSEEAWEALIKERLDEEPAEGHSPLP